MPDIFISYKKEERTVAIRLATRLTEAGYDVWWDAALLAGERFEDEIAAVLMDSRAVVVLWSRKSVGSDWVKAEAETARQQKKALPAVIDDLPIDGLPLLFRGLHVTYLTGWEGEPDHPGYTELMKALRDRLGAAKGPELSAPQAEAKLAQSVGEAEVWAAIVSAPNESADEYRAYLKRFGPNGRFAELAQLRIARLEKDDKPAKKRRRSWSPAIVLPLLAVVLVAVAVGGLYLRDGSFRLITDMFVPAEVREAAARCTAWSNSAKTDWATGLPVLEGSAATDCATAVEKFPANGEYLGMLAMVRIAQGGHGDEAIALANRGIDRHGAAANFALASMYDKGVSLPYDAARAGSYFKAASDLGMARASARLCLLAIDDGSVPTIAETPDQITAFCDKAKDAGDALGQVASGYLFESGFNGRSVDYAGAAEFYRRAADQGSIDGQLLLGSLLQRGLGVDRDEARAVGLYSKAAETGNPEALRRLAISYELGWGVPQDVNHAAQLYETASIRRDLIALLLANYSTSGVHATARLNRDIEWLAASGSVVGQRMLGELYQTGFLRAADQQQAGSLYAQCAGAGNAMCQSALGYFDFYGLGGTRDPAKALEEFEASAAQGNMYGQFWAGWIYETGDGVPVDIDKALSLYRPAAAQGHLSAINRIAALAQPSASPKS